MMMIISGLLAGVAVAAPALAPSVDGAATFSEMLQQWGGGSDVARERSRRGVSLLQFFSLYFALASLFPSPTQRCVSARSNQPGCR